MLGWNTGRIGRGPRVGFGQQRSNKMAEDQSKPGGPDLTQGVDLDALPDGGMLVGHVGEA